jgi:hypothetical protein
VTVDNRSRTLVNGKSREWNPKRDEGQPQLDRFPKHLHLVLLSAI